MIFNWVYMCQSTHPETYLKFNGHLPLERSSDLQGALQKRISDNSPHFTLRCWKQYQPDFWIAN